MGGQLTRKKLPKALYKLTDLVYQSTERRLIVLIDEYDPPTSYAVQSGHSSDVCPLTYSSTVFCNLQFVDQLFSENVLVIAQGLYSTRVKMAIAKTNVAGQRIYSRGPGCGHFAGRKSWLAVWNE